MNEGNECIGCGCAYLLRDECEPTPYCDSCAHEKLQLFLDREPLVLAALHEAAEYSQYEDLNELVVKALDFRL